MKNQRGQSKPVSKEAASPTQVVALVIVILQELLKFLKMAVKGQVQNLLDNATKFSRGFGRLLRECSQMPDDAYADMKAKWSAFYQKHFNLTLDFTNLVIPERPAEGNWRLIIVAAGLTINQVYDACAKQFACCRYVNDLDSNIKDVAKRPDGTYAIWVRANIEADEEFKNKSADDLATENHNGITLKERMLLELDYFGETGKHLDLANWTLCSGSRYVDGSVPIAYWNVDDGFDVSWALRDCRDRSLRSRLVVS